MKKLSCLLFLAICWQLHAAELQEFDESDRGPLRRLEDIQPNYIAEDLNEESPIRFGRNKFIAPNLPVHLDEIIASGYDQLAIKYGAPLQDVKTGKIFATKRDIIVNAYKRADEHGFRYLRNDDGKIIYRVNVRHASPIKDVTAMYILPRKFKTVDQSEKPLPWDKNLRFYPEVNFATSVISANYTADLLNDTNARNTTNFRYGASGFLRWPYRFALGGTLQYERSVHQIAGGNATFSSISIGPVFRSKTFLQDNWPIRISTQLRWNLNTNLVVNKPGSSETLKLAVTTWQVSLEKPYKNAWGEFYVAANFQRQWMNLRGQSRYVTLDSQQGTNDQIGLSIGQGFFW